VSRLMSHSLVKIDDKGRLVLPAAHRSRYEEGAILSFRNDHIAIYEPVEWDSFVLQLRDNRINGQMTREFFNWVLMNTCDPKVDSAGRVLLPTYMREALKLDREALVGGNFEYLGIYPPDYVTTISPRIAEQANDVINRLGL